MSDRFLVHYWADNGRHTPGRCFADHRLKPWPSIGAVRAWERASLTAGEPAGDFLDVGDERVYVRSCALVTTVEPRRPTNQGDSRPT